MKQWRMAIAALFAIAAGLSAGSVAAQSEAGLEQRVAALEAKEAIRGPIYAYGRALDSRNFVDFAGLFAEDDGTWVGGFGAATGRDAIFAMMDSSIWIFVVPSATGAPQQQGTER